MMARPQSHSLVTRKVLVADDSLPGLLAVKAMLEAEGIICDTANDGSSALAKAQHERYDALLLDEHMPGLQGSAICVALRGESGPNQHAMIISLSGEQGSGHRAVMDAAGFDAMLAKPVSKLALVSVLSESGDSESSIKGDDIAGFGGDEALLDVAVHRDMQEQFDPATVARLFGLFIDELSVLSARLSTAIDHNSETEVMAVAHILKNSAELYGAKHLSCLARYINEAPPSGREQIIELAEQLLAVCHETRQKVQVELL